VRERVELLQIVHRCSAPPDQHVLQQTALRPSARAGFDLGVVIL